MSAASCDTSPLRDGTTVNAEEAAIDERIMAHASEGHMCQRPLGCDCPGCVERYGPIAPGNIGKELRSNPTGDFTNPRAG